jgi:hypothetical protein
MIDAVLWLAGGAFAVLAVLITYSAWVDVKGEEEHHRHD